MGQVQRAYNGEVMIWDEAAGGRRGYLEAAGNGDGSVTFRLTQGSSLLVQFVVTEDMAVLAGILRTEAG